MSDSIETLRLRVLEALDGVEFRDQSENEMREFLLAKLAGYDITAYIGWILHAGKCWNGEFQVQFNVQGGGWSSRWPEWAYDAARDALLHEKKIWVISNGVPFGPNILQALVTNIRL
jgi:hypothetical protein